LLPACPMNSGAASGGQCPLTAQKETALA